MSHESLIIWVVCDGEPLPIDQGNPRLLRTSILAERLAALGHDVVYWSSRYDHFHKRDRHDKVCKLPSGLGYDIQLVDRVPYKRNISLARLRHNVRVKTSMKKRMESEASKPDIIVADLPTIELADLCTELGLKWNVPTFVCIRDLWPDVYLSVLPAGLRRLFKPILFSLQRAASRALKNATGLIGISQGYLDWGLKNAGRSQHEQDRIISLGYPKRPVESEIAPKEAMDKLIELGVDFKRPICVFVGTFGHSYDLTTVISAVEKLDYSQDDPQKAPQFVFCGDGGNAAKWRGEAEKVISNRKQKFPGAGVDIIFSGWLQGPELMALLDRSSIGLAAYAEGALQGLPNKFFEYMSYGLPVVSSLSGEAAVEIEANNFGLNYKAGDSQDLANKLSEILSDNKKMAQMASNASACFAEKYEEEVIYEEYANFVVNSAKPKT